MKRRLNLMPVLAVVTGLIMSFSALGDTVEIEQRFSMEELTLDTSFGFDRVRIEGGSLTSEVGAPWLPAVEVHVALPLGAQATGVRAFEVDEQTVPGRYEIMPCAEPLILGEEMPIGHFRSDPVFYGKDAPYPERRVKMLNQWELAGLAFVTVEIFPVRYEPRAQRLTLTTGLTLEVEYDAAKNAVRPCHNLGPVMQDRLMKRMRDMAANPEALKDWPEQPCGPQAKQGKDDQYLYVIITDAPLKPRFKRLAHWRTQTGMPARIVDTDWIYSSYPGMDRTEKIREFIIDANTSWGTFYFLLAGDFNLVPPHMRDLPAQGSPVPNDTYYSDFDDDFICDVYVGRTCVNDEDDCNRFVDKVLNYEKQPPAGFGDEVFFMAFNADGQTDTEDCKIAIHQNSVPPEVEFYQEYDSEPGIHKQDILDLLNTGINLVNHCDHGDTRLIGAGSHKHDEWIDDMESGALMNGERLINFYSLACYVANFQADSWAEAFVNSDQGGITYTGNTRYGWYDPGQTDTKSCLYDMFWWSALYEDNAYLAGETLAFSKAKNTPSSTAEIYIHTELTLLGDPLLPIWTAEPVAMTVSHDHEIFPGLQSYPVHVEKEGSGLTNALVCLWKGDEVYESGYTDPNGDIEFWIFPRTMGPMTLTVTAQNCLYYQDAVQVGVTLDPGNLERAAKQGRKMMWWPGF